MRDLLYEIGCEELPASFVKPALRQLEENFIARAKNLQIDHGRVMVKGTPRRLTLQVENVADKQSDIREELVGPSVKAGIDGDGKYTGAAMGFARSKNADISELQQVDTAKGPYLMLVREVPGKATGELLPTLLHELLLELNFKKSMRWGANSIAFARPIQWLVALYGETVVPFSHEGISSGNISRGHRFHANKELVIDQPANYEEILRQHSVIVDIADRREKVIVEINNAVANSELLGDARVAVDDELADLVTNLVEQPCGICGGYDEKFLQLPAKVLITSMREHQKYFPVVNGEGDLLPAFVAVNNTTVIDLETTRKGHERVLRARLEDALFFFNSDSATRLEDKRSRLEGIIFQAKLGTVLEKSDRLVKLSRLLAEKIDSDLIDKASRVAYLSKADLISDMVGEFPSLQGVMGSAYAGKDGEPEDVAAAIQEHYMPKRAGAELPASTLGAVVGLADRFDTIAGCFGIGQVPTGTADPFGLRRQSLAILNLIVAGSYEISLTEICHKALALYGSKVNGGGETVEAMLGFIKGRFINDCVAKGVEHGVVDAVTSVGFDDVNDSLARIEALSTIRKDATFTVLAASYKRIRNIVKEHSETRVDPVLFAEDEERSLYQAFSEVAAETPGLLAQKNYGDALEVMLKLKQPIDLFFDEVMVMADDEAVRGNRLNLLAAIGEMVLQIADISKIQEN